MIRGLYTSAAGMLVQWSRQDVEANNLANVNTVGFKRDVTLVKQFPEMLVMRSQDAYINTSKGKMELRVLTGLLGTGAQVEKVVPLFEEGQFHETQNKLDLAIHGDGFFTVQTPQGIRYTRNGAFTMNDKGELVNEEGYYVLGEGGRITLNGKNIAFGEDGTVYVDGALTDRLRITRFPDKTGIEKVGHNLYIDIMGVNETVPPNEVEVKQGYLELSNVNTVTEMSRMIEVMRTYEANQRMIQSQDETLNMAINTIGKPG